MSFGKMNQSIQIINITPGKDAEGFAVKSDTIVANVRAYKEDRHGSVAWKNRAAFSTATALFRFRKIPSVTVNTSLYIMFGGETYKIMSVEDVKGRGMYIEALCERVTPSG